MVEHKKILLENFVAIELTKQLTFSAYRARLYHFRTTSGQEVDFLLEGLEGKIIAIEVKDKSKVEAKDFSHINRLKDDLGPKFHRGFVIYQGEDTVAFGDNLFALPISALWE